MAVKRFDSPVVIEDNNTRIIVGDRLYNIDAFFLALEYTQLEYDEAIELLGYTNE